MEDSSNYWENPYPFYEDLRGRGPVHWYEDAQAWMVTGFSEARAALTNPGLSSRWMSGPALGSLRDPVLEHVRDWLMLIDPPQHKVVRGALSALFTVRKVAAGASRIEARTAAAYAGFVRRGGGDVVEDLVRPLVTGVMAEIVGMEGVDAATLRDWSSAAGSLMARPYQRQVRAEAARALHQLADEVDVRRTRDATTVLGQALPDVRGGGVLHFASMFAFAGIETTTQATARLVDLYLDGVFGHDCPPGVMAAELLRYDTPVPQVPRLATERLRIGGHTIEAGQLVVVILAAANRDPRVFTEPHAVRSRDGAHLAFGYGRHRCIGAPVADAVLGALAGQLSRHPLPGRRGPADWHTGRGYRAIARLPLRYDCPGAR